MKKNNNDNITIPNNDINNNNISNNWSDAVQVCNSHSFGSCLCTTANTLFNTKDLLVRMRMVLIIVM